MKKLMTVAMLALSVAAFAQTGKQSDKKSKENQSTEIRTKKDGDKKEGRKDGKHKGGKKRGEDKFADLNLTDVQKSQLKALKGERKAKGELAQNTKPSKEEMQAKRAERNAQIKTILTPEQYQKFSAKKEMEQKKESKS